MNPEEKNPLEVWLAGPQALHNNSNCKVNGGNLDKIENSFGTDSIKKVRGLKSLKKWLSLERSIFPDMQFRIVDNLAEHDKVAIRWILQATLKKKPSNHQKLQIMGMSIFQFEDDNYKQLEYNRLIHFT